MDLVRGTQYPSRPPARAHWPGTRDSPGASLRGQPNLLSRLLSLPLHPSPSSLPFSPLHARVSLQFSFVFLLGVHLLAPCFPRAWSCSCDLVISDFQLAHSAIYSIAPTPPDFPAHRALCSRSIFFFSSHDSRLIFTPSHTPPRARVILTRCTSHLSSLPGQITSGIHSIPISD